MSHKTGNLRRSWRERALSLLLAAVMLLGMAPGLTLPASAEHWADSYLDQLVDWGVMRADQTGNPDAQLTRAEFMAIVNRAYGYSETGPIPFTDVQPQDWFYDDVAIAYTAGYMNGTSATTAAPNASLTREMAVCILARNMMMKETVGEDISFSDSRDISSWARGLVKTAVDNYIVGGYPDNTFHAQEPITKGQMAALVTRCVGQPINEGGSVSLGGVYGNVTITSPGVTLRDTTISGDLYVSGGVGLGNTRLENVKVLGRIIVSGTGESESGAASVIMRNVTANEMLVDNMRNKYVTVQVDGVTEIARTVVRTPAYLEDNNVDGKGMLNITLDGEEGTTLDLAGRIKTVVNKTPGSTINVAKGTVESLTVDEAAVNAVTHIERNAEVKVLNLDVATNVTGTGDIGTLNVNAPGCTVAMLPDKIYIRPGITANIAGVVMDSTMAEESSLDPRILSGYPAASDVAPTNFKAEFSANKRGTLYWAVSSITDGSITADDLISPPAYGSRAISSGSLTVPAGDTPVSSQVAGLTVGGSYYLSAVLVDGREQRSPVKVVSFSTPDDTVPAFAQGYPYMSLITDTMAQVTVMPTKSCKLYYAVLPRGAQAPTVAEMRAGSVTGNLGFGVVDVIKNTERVINVSNRLQELKDYTLYLMLADADSTQTSAVVPLQFTTVDMTPPIFVVDPYVKDIKINSVGLGAAINEDGTIYWAVVEAGTAYPKPNGQNDGDNTDDGETAKLDSDYAKLQVVNGMNALQRGQVAARANTEVAITVNGLEPEKAYDLYYLAKDNVSATANYSVKVEKITIHTLDNSGPVVNQYFTRYSGTDNTKDPMNDTDIVLEFNENICSVNNAGKDLLSLYEAVSSSSADDQAEAMAAFTDALRNSFTLYQQVAGIGEQKVKVRDDVGVGNDWVIDYKQAYMQNRDGKYQLVFPSEGLQINSGATYFFEISNLTDSSTARNHIAPSIVRDNEESRREGHNVPRFTVVFARLLMTQFDLTNNQWPDGVRKSNENKPNSSYGDYQIDFSFRMIPDATSTVEDGMGYDLLFWTDTTMEYDLYYRVVTVNDNTPVTKGSGTNKAGETVEYAMPNMDGKDGPCANGWVLLGNSDEILTNGEELFGKSLQRDFNGCNQGTIPNINTLDDSGNVYYEFAVSIKKMGSGSNSRNPETWSGTVNFYVDAAAGTSGNLYRLTNGGLTESSWAEFVSNGLGRNGGESIGATDNPDNPKRLHMATPFSDTLQPSFAEHFPTFKAGAESVTMDLTLDRPGTIYYAIAPADNSGQELADLTTWVPTIRTLVDDPDAPNGERTIRPDEVPEDGDDPITMPTLKTPERGNIFDPSKWSDGQNAVTGSVPYRGVESKPKEVEGLEPNRTYYAYLVITGSAREPSKVYIYKFKTNPMPRPKINLNSVDDGTTNGVYMTTTNMDSTMWYLLYPETDLKRIFRMQDSTTESTGGADAPDTAKDLGKYMLKDVLSDTAKDGLPSAYETYTILEAMQTKYSWSVASSGGTTLNDGKYYPRDGEGKYDAFDDYSVFDIYASDSIKAVFVNWITSGTLVRSSMGYEMKNDRAPETAQTGKDISIMRNNEFLGADSPDVARGMQYYIITVARSPEAEETDPIGDTYSFLAAPYRRSDQRAPELTSGGGWFTIESSSGTVMSGQINLSFDRPLYTGSPNNTVKVTNSNFFAATDTTEGIEKNKIGVTTTETASTVSLPLKAQSMVISATVGSGHLTNFSGTAADKLLDIRLEREQVGSIPSVSPGGQDTPIYDYYINIYWGGERIGHIPGTKI